VRLSPSIQEQSRTLTIEPKCRTKRAVLRPGSFARRRSCGDRPTGGLRAPVVARVFAGIEKILSVKDGRSIEKRVTTGRKDKERVEILEGLAAGEPVIVEPGISSEASPWSSSPSDLGPMSRSVQKLAEVCIAAPSRVDIVMALVVVGAASYFRGSASTAFPSVDLPTVTFRTSCRRLHRGDGDAGLAEDRGSRQHHPGVNELRSISSPGNSLLIVILRPERNIDVARPGTRATRSPSRFATCRATSRRRSSQ